VTDEDAALVVLMVEYQKGEVEAFASLYDALAGDLARHFASLLRGSVASQDLVQETFIEIHRSRHTYLAPLPVRPWIFGVARNVLRRHRRSAWRRARYEENSGHHEGSIAAARARRIDGRDVQEALEAVPAARRDAWELHHVHGFSFEEIARMLVIPVGAAKLRSSRAMGVIRALLGVSRGSRRG
jgi:RNA polymerase sigma-70 factor, ECF subfamily